MASSILFALFIITILLFIYLFGGEIHIVSSRMLSSAERVEYDLGQFINNEGKRTNPRKRYVFSEESVVSMTHRYNGRFDSVIVRWSGGPLLEAVIERKFPMNVLPEGPVPEDMFQASLYALALKEKGLSISSTRLINIYCLQNEAERCLERKGSESCIGCSKGVVYTKRFNESKTLRELEKLDEIWYKGRKPSPKPSKRICRICPYGRNGICNHSAV